MRTTWHVWYTDELVVTLLADHTILLPGRCPHINFHVCVLHLKHIRLIFSKPDIEISGGSEKKNWTDRRFSKHHFVLRRNKKNKAQPIVGKSRLVASPESVNTKSY